jgi:hypothetical protein
MDRLVLLKKEPDRRVSAVSRTATRGKRLTYQLHLISLSLPLCLTTHIVKLQHTYLSMRFLMMFYTHTYIYTLVNEYIHIYTHTQTQTHPAFHFTLCIKGVHNGEVAPLCPYISFLRLRDAHPSNLTCDVLVRCFGKFNYVIITPNSQDDLTNHYHYLYKKLVMT